MMQINIMLLIMITSLIFIQMNHPLAMGLTLLIQTFLICLITGLMTKTFWFSYILFLIFLGGMLVLFIYVTSLASNEMFSMSMKLTLLMILMYMTFMFIFMIMDKSMISFMSENMEMNSMNYLNNFISENSISLNKLYNYPTNLITIILINYLLLTLIAVVKITNIFYGPLRTMY